MLGISIFVYGLLIVSLILLGLVYLEEYIQDYNNKYNFYEDEEDYREDFSSRLDKKSAEIFNKLNHEEII